MTTLKIGVDIVPGVSSPSVSVSQGDHESRTLLITLLNNGKKDFTIPAGATVEVRGTKPSGKGFNYPCTFNGNLVEVTVKDQMTAESGRVPCEIVIESDGRVLSSANFDMVVERSALQPGTVASSDTFDSLARKVVVNAEGNLFANALKGYASGETLQLDDVSPIEHSPRVGVHGKNFFNTSIISLDEESETENYVSEVAAGSLTITSKEGYSGNGFKNIGLTLKELCPQITAGKKYILTAESSAYNKIIYFVEAEQVWPFGSGLTITEKMLNSVICFYGLNSMNDGRGVCKISGIQLEAGTAATDYEPWLDPTTITVTDGNGNTFTPNTDGTIEGVTSTSPTMTLSTDTEGAIIECEYNRDLTAAIERIEAALFN